MYKAVFIILGEKQEHNSSDIIFKIKWNCALFVIADFKGNLDDEGRCNVCIRHLFDQWNTLVLSSLLFYAAHLCNLRQKKLRKLGEWVLKFSCHFISLRRTASKLNHMLQCPVLVSSGEKKWAGRKANHNLLINTWLKSHMKREPLLRHLQHNHFPFFFSFLKQRAQRQVNN